MINQNQTPNLELTHEPNRTFIISDVQVNFIYVPYKACVDDIGWGCAWRCIQMILSIDYLTLNNQSKLKTHQQSQKRIFNIKQFPIQHSFRRLYETYSSEQSLFKIVEYLQSQKLIAIGTSIYLKSSKGWAPADAKGFWAEPFIAYLICCAEQMCCIKQKLKSRDKFDILNSIFILNKIPVCNAPKEVLNQCHKFNFTEFLELILTRLNKGEIVMIDDGIIALIIFYAQKIDEQTGLVKLKIADPHILSNLTNDSVGLYEVTVNNKGELISHSVSQNSKQFYYADTFNRISFESKGWMIFVRSNL